MSENRNIALMEYYMYFGILKTDSIKKQIWNFKKSEKNTSDERKSFPKPHSKIWLKV